MALPTYNQFIANVQEADIKALAMLTNNNVISAATPAEADVIYAQLERLFTYDLINNVKRGYVKQSDGSTWQTFEVRVQPTALNYLAQAAMERVVLSRNPIPPAP